MIDKTPTNTSLVTAAEATAVRSPSRFSGVTRFGGAVGVGVGAILAMRGIDWAFDKITGADQKRSNEQERAIRRAQDEADRRYREISAENSRQTAETLSRVLRESSEASAKVIKAAFAEANEKDEKKK